MRSPSSRTSGGTKSILSCHRAFPTLCGRIIMRTRVQYFEFERMRATKMGLTTGFWGPIANERRAGHRWCCNDFSDTPFMCATSCDRSRYAPNTRNARTSRTFIRFGLCWPFRFVVVSLFDSAWRWWMGFRNDDDNNNNNSAHRRPDRIVLSLCVRHISGRHSRHSRPAAKQHSASLPACVLRDDDGVANALAS